MRIALWTATAIAISTSAYAADAVDVQQSNNMADAYLWSGGYVGVNAGYAWGKDKVTTQWYMEGYDFLPEHQSNSFNGFIGGAQIGYNWQIDRAVIGVESDVQYTDLKTKLSDGGYETYSASKINWLGTTRAKIGYTPIDRVLVYATGGVAYGGIKAKVVDYFSFDSSISKTKFGYAVGAGAEYALSGNWTIKAEYLYAGLGKVTHRIYEFDSKNYDTRSHKFSANITRIGLNYRF